MFKGFSGKYGGVRELREVAEEMKGNLSRMWSLIFVLSLSFHLAKRVPKAMAFVFHCVLFLIWSFHRYQ